jgi:hypothetical protein
MSKRYILDGNKEPVLCEDNEQWYNWMRMNSNRYLLESESNVPGLTIHTSFLGEDTRRGMSGSPPYLFKTFTTGTTINYATRHKTFDSAQARHARLIGLTNRDSAQPPTNTRRQDRVLSSTAKYKVPTEQCCDLPGTEFHQYIESTIHSELAGEEDEYPYNYEDGDDDDDDDYEDD